jgi:hypothetical protein
MRIGSMGLAALLVAGNALSAQEIPSFEPLLPRHDTEEINVFPLQAPPTIQDFPPPPASVPQTLPGKAAPMPQVAAPKPAPTPIISLAPAPAANAKIEPISQGQTDFWAAPCSGPITRLWGSVEALYWHMNNASIAVPLVTANPNAASIGALNEPGTRILFGSGSGANSNFGWFTGGRVTAGGWLDKDQRFGLEGSGFLFENRTILFGASSAGSVSGGQVLSIPFNATQPFGINPAGPTSLNSGGGPNTIGATLASRLWGAEANGVVSIYNSKTLHVAGLVGFRYLDLQESLNLSDSFYDPTSGLTINTSDYFATRNQFYGGQLGARVGWNWSRFTLEATAKVALGDNVQTLSIQGGTNVPAGAFGLPGSATPGGVFAEPSNMGHFHRNVFAVVPEGQLKLGFALSQHISTFVGYNFLYLNNALRPGNQLNANINPTQNAFYVPPGTLSGPASPLAAFHNSNFWAQGVSGGIEFKF